MNYHNFVLAQLRKEREMHERQLELDLGSSLRCHHCDDELPQPHFVVKRNAISYVYCNEACANEHALEKLRESGL